MGRRSRECYLCGRHYEYCGSCSNDRMKPAWMSEFHSESCKNIFDICTRFNMNLMSKSEAQDALNACDLTNKENFKSYVIRDLENIFKVDEVSVQAEEPIVVNVEAKIEKVTKDEIIVDVAPVRNKFKNKSHEVVYKKENE